MEITVVFPTLLSPIKTVIPSVLNEISLISSLFDHITKLFNLIMPYHQLSLFLITHILPYRVLHFQFF